MATYYFDVCSKEVHVSDREGTALSDLDSAVDEAVGFALAVACEGLSDPGSVTIKVRGEDDAVVVEATVSLHVTRQFPINGVKTVQSRKAECPPSKT
jgi:uncharacterized protein DUF6894